MGRADGVDPTDPGLRQTDDHVDAGPEGWRASDAPLVNPLSYPGEWPPHSILMTRSSQHTLDVPHDRRIGQSRVLVGVDEDFDGTCLRERSDYPLNYVLLQLNKARVDDRSPVLAVGSNASPAQMRHKFEKQKVSLSIPMVEATVRGLTVGVAAEVASMGYVPATPILGPDLTCSLFIQWLDARQMRALDETEPGYDRVLVPAGDPAAGGVCIELPSGEVLGACYLYVAARGCLLDGNRLRRLAPQEEIITDLLAKSADLRDLLGTTPASWIDRIGEPGAIEAARKIFKAEGWVVRQPRLDELVEAQQATPTPRPYGQILSATPPSPDAWRVLPTREPVVRHGQSVVRLDPKTYDDLGAPLHVAVRPAAGADRPDIANLRAIATVLVDEAATDSSLVEVDQVIRDGIGVEVGEDVCLERVHIGGRSWLSPVLGPPTYVTCRVQISGMAIIERDVVLLDPLTMELLGVESGEEVVVEGYPPEGSTDDAVAQVRVKALVTPGDVGEGRVAIQGGDFSVRYPSAIDALGVHPDIAWIFMDMSIRSMLGLRGQRLATVRVRASRSFQLRKELREMVLLLAITFIGIIEILSQTLWQVAAMAVMVALTFGAIAVRMRGRLTSRAKRTGR